jgi:hypothetical protein
LIEDFMNRIGNNLVPAAPSRGRVENLLDAKVRFVVVGGLAIAWLVAEVRPADAMDPLL